MLLASQRSLTQVAAKELKGTDVYCVAVCPEGIKTRMREAVYGATDSSRQQEPDRVAKVIADLAISKAVEGKSVSQGGIVIVRKDAVSVIEMEDG